MTEKHLYASSVWSFRDTYHHERAKGVNTVVELWCDFAFVSPV